MSEEELEQFEKALETFMEYASVEAVSYTHLTLPTTPYV